MIRSVVTAGAISGLLVFAACDNTANNNTAPPPRPTNANTAVLTNTNAAANTNAAHKTVDYNTPDGVITAKTWLELAATKDVPSSDIDVDTVDGVVTLNGKVETDAQKTAAGDTAKKVGGVKSVNNQIQVVPGSAAKAVEAKDDEIEKAANDWLDNDPSVKDQHLKAKSNAGVVTINGDVDNYGELVKAAQGVRKVAGVKSVVTTAVHVKNEGGANANTNGKMGTNK